MPKSKRDKKISLTKTKKKTLDFKQKLVEDIRCNLDKYERLFVFSVENMRNVHLKDVRQQWKHSRFFFGKSKVMALALGRTETETRGFKNLHLLTACVRGQCGLLFTDEKQSKVIDWFSTYIEPEFARSGFKATETVTLNAGPIMDFKTPMEPELRRLGLPTAIKMGAVTLREDFTVCNQGQILTPSQAQILKHLGIYMAEFRVSLVAVWSKDGTFEILEKKEGNELTEEVEEMDDD